MPQVDFSESDLLRNKLITPGWYRLELGLVGEWTPSKDAQSNNCVIDALVLFNADTGDKEFTGVPVSIQFNDKPKARGFIEGFLRGLGIDVEANKRYELKNAAGMQIDAFIENETYEGRTRNRINHKYRQVRAETV